MLIAHTDDPTVTTKVNEDTIEGACTLIRSTGPTFEDKIAKLSKKTQKKDDSKKDD